MEGVVHMWQELSGVLKYRYKGGSMAKVKEEITTSSNIGVLPEAPPQGKLKIRHKDTPTQKDGLKKIIVRTPTK